MNGNRRRTRSESTAQRVPRPDRGWRDGDHHPPRAAGRAVGTRADDGRGAAGGHEARGQDYLEWSTAARLRTPRCLCATELHFRTWCSGSALAKRYLLEPGSGDVRALVGQADHVAASVVTLPEVMSAIRRNWGTGGLDERGAGVARAELLRDWAAVLVLPADVATIGHAASIVWEHR